MSNNAIWSKDKEHFIHPYTNFQRFPQDGSTIFTEGKGHFIYDIDGNSYLDGMAGLWCVNIGHGNEELAAHIGEQAARLAYYNTFEDASSVPAAELAHKLAEICPGHLNRVFFGTGGSMANDTAIKLIHYYFNQVGKPNKKKVISRDLGYHGSTYLAHALTGIRSTHLGFDLAYDLVHYVSAPHIFKAADFTDESAFCDHLIDELEAKIHELGPENVSCFIAEPVMGAGGVIVPPQGYHQRTWELCKAHDIFYISDEVVTGFGRLGHMIASKDRFGIEPDVLILAKGISSGYVPLGATVISDEIYEVIKQPKSENPYLSHGFTYSGHALSCAAGLKNIEIMERLDLCGHVRQWGPYLESQLNTLKQHDLIGDVRGSHYMMCLEVVADPNVPELNAQVGKRIYQLAKKRGLMFRSIGPLCVFSPPLTFDHEAIDRSVAIMNESIELAKMELTQGNLA